MLIRVIRVIRGSSLFATVCQKRRLAQMLAGDDVNATATTRERQIESNSARQTGKRFLAVFGVIKSMNCNEIRSPNTNRSGNNEMQIAFKTGNIGYIVVRQTLKWQQNWQHTGNKLATF